MKKALASCIAAFLLFAMTGCQKPPAATEIQATTATPAPTSYADLSACFVGDSITYGHSLAVGEQIYWQRVSEVLKFKETVGMGINGSCYSTTSAYGSKNSPLAERYTQIPQTDLIFIMLGTNDFYQKTPMGTIEDQEDVSFYGAINFCLNELEKQCPNSTIILMTPICVNGNNTNKIGVTLDEYVNAVLAVAEKRQLLVMDMHNLTEADLTEGFFNDVAHPNQYGQQVMGDALLKWLDENKDTIIK